MVMHPKDRSELRRLMTLYGTFGVVEQVSHITVEKCDNEFQDNPEAVIHRDCAMLSECVAKMKRNSFMRCDSADEAMILFDATIGANSGED